MPARWSGRAPSPGRRAGVRVDHLVAERVQRPGDAGADLARAQHPAVLVRGRRDLGARTRRASGRSARVEQAAEVGDVGRRPARGQAVQRGVDAEPDHPDRPGAVDEHVLGDQPAVGDPGARGRPRSRPPPPRPARPPGAGPSGPSVASMMSSELPEPHSLTTKQRPSTRSASSTRSSRRSGTVADCAGRLEQARGPLVVGVEHVQGDVALRTRSWARQKRPPRSRRAGRPGGSGRRGRRRAGWSSARSSPLRLARWSS